MALSESALSELLVALADRDRGVDLVRELAQWLAQELIEVQATQVIGAGRYERCDERVTERNGYRSRTLTTKAGDLELAIPKLRKGSFFPSILEPRRRIDQALHAVVMEAYVSGVSTRSVDALVESMGAASGISKSEVSRICAGLDERVAAFRNRTLGHTEFPYVYLDAIYVHVRDDALGQVVSRAIVVATGVTAQGGREVLGVDVGDSEAETFWTAFLRSLKARGLTGVRLVISDAHEGLRAAIRKTLLGTSWQRCRVHFVRNLLAPVPKASQEMVAAAFRSIFTLTTPADVTARWDEVAVDAHRAVPESRRADGHGEARRARVHRVPQGALAVDLVEQPPRTLEQGDPPAHRRRGHLPQRPRRDPPRRCRARRPTRRMGRRPPLLLRSLDGQALHARDCRRRHRRARARRLTTTTDRVTRTPPLRGTLTNEKHSTDATATPQCRVSRGGLGSRPGATVSESRMRPSLPWIRTSPPPWLETIAFARRSA